MDYRQKKGKWGENFAEDYLRLRGLKIISRNERTPYGEIDIIAQEGDLLVYVEVKTRSTKEFGYPENAVNFRKRKHLIDSALYLSEKYQELGENWRIDVISIFKPFGKNSSPQVEWFQNAIDG